METLLKKPVLRDSMGRFDRHGKALAKTAKKTGLINNHVVPLADLVGFWSLLPPTAVGKTWEFRSR